MTDPAHEKTPLEESRDMIAQLKGMSHYSKTNIESSQSSGCCPKAK